MLLGEKETNHDQRRRLTQAGIQWQEPGEYVRDDQARLEASAVDPKPVDSPAFVRRAICGVKNNCCAGPECFRGSCASQYFHRRWWRENLPFFSFRGCGLYFYFRAVRQR